MGFNENNAFDGIRDDDLWKVDEVTFYCFTEAFIIDF